MDGGPGDGRHAADWHAGCDLRAKESCVHYLCVGRRLQLPEREAIKKGNHRPVGTVPGTERIVRHQLHLQLARFLPGAVC